MSVNNLTTDEFYQHCQLILLSFTVRGAIKRLSNVRILFLPLQAAAASIQETHGSLDLLINSTGILSIPNVIQPGEFSTSITSEPNVQKSASTDSLVTYLKPGSFCFLSQRLH